MIRTVREAVTCLVIAAVLSTAAIVAMRVVVERSEIKAAASHRWDGPEDLRP